MPAPANNDWASATAVVIALDGDTFSDVVDGTDAAREFGEPFAFSDRPTKTVWYSYTPFSGGQITVDTIGSVTVGTTNPADTVIAVYTGPALDTLTLVGFDDDGATDPWSGNSAFTFTGTGDTTYWIQVGNYSTSNWDTEYHFNVTGPATISPGQITGVPAIGTAGAYPAPYPPISIVVDGEPATATATAQPATDVRAYEWAATATATAPPAKPPNDDFADAYSLTGASGSVVLPALGASREFFEPAGVAAPEDAESLWATYTPAVPGDLTLTVPTGMAVEIWEGDDFLDLVYVAGAASTVSAAVAQDVTYRIRLLPTSVGAIPVAVTVSWAYTERVAELVLNVDDAELEDTPTTVRVSLLNGTPDGPVEFTFNGAVIYSDVFDASGVIADLELAIPETPAGTYTLLATDTTDSDYDDIALTILEDPLGEPDDLPADIDPVIDPEVTRWVIKDPYSGGVPYTFPINPREMSTPFAARALTVETTTSPEGQPLVWEGAFRPHQWQFTGHIETQAFYEALEGYAASNQRWWLIDHRHRAWLVTFEAFEPTLRTRTDPAAPYRSTYVMRCLTYRGPVTL